MYSVGASTTKGGLPFHWQYRSGYLALHLLELLLLLTDYLVLHFSFSSSLFGLPVCWFFHLLLIPGARGCFPPVERFGMTILWLVVILQFEAPVMASWLTD